MDIGIIDYWANRGDSILHRASAPSKVVAAALIVGGVVMTANLFVLLAIYLAVAAVIISARLPALRIAAIAAYPAIFALIFAVSRWDGSLLSPAIIVLRSLAAALTMLMLITTTPYPQVFATFHRFVPRAVGDGLFLTYRSLFIILDLLGDIWIALRLRGGVTRGRYVKNVVNVSYGLGLLALRAFRLSQRLYDVMRLRGYAGRLVARRRARKLSACDLYPLGLGASLAALSAATTLWPAILIPYVGYAPLAALAALLGAAACTHLTAPRVGRG